jgi:UDP-N-acetylmuramyl tripeptide synthase
MFLRDSRRLTGPNLVLDSPGAVIEVVLHDERPQTVADAWRESARRILDAVGWNNERLATRTQPGGMILAHTAPIDALYAATEVNEWAWAAAEAALAGRAEPPIEEGARALRAVIEAEERPALRALAAAAAVRDVAFLSDGELATVGSGTGSLSWPLAELPHPDAIDWQRVHDVPVVLVTGTNGKTTTVRLLAAMAAAAGKVPGVATTDGITVQGETVAHGDYSGPGGARLVLRHPRVEVACLETARGGILRRGLAVRRAQAALITNVAADHLGEFGVHDLDGLVATKLVVTRVVGSGGRVVLNGDDQRLRERAREITAPITWFTLDPGLGGWGAVGRTCTVESGGLVLARDGRRERVVAVSEVPIFLDGKARHNVYNALGAVGLADHLGFPIAAMAEALIGFRNTPAQNPGRGNLLELGGVHILVDYAHNPHGMASVVAMVAGLPSRRRLVVLGQAGDRDDEAIRELARTAWQLRPDRVVVKELRLYLRGRAEGEVPALLENELRRLGASPDAVARAGSEMAAVREALAWARPGDLLVLPIHEERAAVLDLLASLQAEGWTAGDETGLDVWLGHKQDLRSGSPRHEVGP